MDRKGASGLKKALNLIRNGKAKQAGPLLVEILRQDPNNHQAWFLLSYAVEDPERQRTALLKALTVAPTFERARTRMASLGFAAPPAPPPPPPTPATPEYKLPSDEDAPSFDELRYEPVAREQDPDRMAFSIDEPSTYEEPQLTLEERGIRPRPRRPMFWAASIVVVVLAVVAANWLLNSPFSFSLLAQATSPRATAIASATMAPTWTTTPALSPSPTSEPTLAIQLPPVDAGTQRQLQPVQNQVASLRALQFDTPPESVLVPTAMPALVLANLYLDENSALRLNAEEIMLGALGLLNPTDFLTDYALSSQADARGGFYVPDQNRIYLVGDQLVGPWPYTYAGLSALALTNQNHPLAAKPLSGCAVLDDTCRAQRALLLGDAWVAAEEWLDANGDEALIQLVADQPTDPRLIQSQAPPRFVIEDLNFASGPGMDFVRTVFDAAGWPNVELVYENPPVSTEHLLHPEKYVAGEAPVAVNDANFGTVLGSGWALVGQGGLGEWLTRLVLSSGVLEDARASASVAADAASGWGGDRVQAYLREQDGAVALAAHWVMDSAADANQLGNALQNYVGDRFGEQAAALGSGACWAGEGERSCVFASGTEVLWLVGPDEIVVLQVMLAQYPQFQ